MGAWRPEEGGLSVDMKELGGQIGVPTDSQPSGVVLGICGYPQLAGGLHNHSTFKRDGGTR